MDRKWAPDFAFGGEIKQAKTQVLHQLDNLPILRVLVDFLDGTSSWVELDYDVVFIGDEASELSKQKWLENQQRMYGNVRDFHPLFEGHERQQLLQRWEYKMYSKIEDVSITTWDRLRLSTPTFWFNDVIINAFIKFCKSTLTGYNNCVLLDCTISSIISNWKDNSTWLAACKRNLRPHMQSMSNCSLTVLPMNISNNHFFVLALVNFFEMSSLSSAMKIPASSSRTLLSEKTPYFVVFDSLWDQPKRSSNHKFACDRLTKALSSLPHSDELYNLPIFVARVPQQTNSYDCGVCGSIEDLCISAERINCVSDRNSLA